jgi:imidazole glycerol-phosphate synthase subunit HisH
MIGLLDYGLSNLRSVQKAFDYLGAPVQVIDKATAVASADKLILPGVGAFAAGMRGLQEHGLVEAIQTAVAQGIPLLGICLGMQLLFDSSEESPGVAGLGLLPGTVRRFDDRHFNGRDLVVPHMGWNQLEKIKPVPLLATVQPGSYAYFVHSYFCEPADPASVWAVSDYGRDFPAIAGRGHICGIQFHPEKSQATGLAILRNFIMNKE